MDTLSAKMALSKKGRVLIRFWFLTKEGIYVMIHALFHAVCGPTSLTIPWTKEVITAVRVQ